MFERLFNNDSMALKRYIGNYVSHCVVGPRSDGTLLAVEDLNELDRRRLAREWYRYETEGSVWKARRFNTIIARFYGCQELFLDEVARYIDERIPRAYMKYHPTESGSGDSPANYVVKCDEDGNLPFGLIYHYPENKKLPGNIVGATPKQLSFLESLAAKNNHYFMPEGITKDEARVCIDYFLNMDEKKEPDCFSKYLKRGV